jgi:hypothetical protein
MAIRRTVTVMSGSPRRRQVLVVAVVGLAAALVFGLLLVGQTRAPAERAEGEGTAWESVLSQIGPDGEVSFETALAAFSIAIGPLPGVQIPPGAATTVASGTGAIRWLSGYRSRLTDEQRAAVDRYLAPDPDAIRVEPGHGFSGRVASVSTELVGLGAAVPAARTPQEEQLLRYLDDARGEIARLLRRPLLLPYTFAINEKQETADLAYTNPHFGANEAGKPSACEFRVNPSMFDTKRGYGDAEFRASMAHEMFHCFQAAAMSGLGQWNDTLTSRPWLIEGSAEWAGEALGGPSSIGRDWWTNYLRHPETRLFARGYDAVGFYLHMVERGVDPWVHLDKMMVTTNEAAYHEAADAGGEPFLDSWASGHVRETVLGNAWVANGPWSVTSHAFVAPMSVPRGDVRTIRAEPYTGFDYRISTPAEILHVQPEGHVRLADGSGFDKVVSVPLLLCVAGKACACPPGSTDTGPTFITVSQPLAAGLTGAVGGASLVMKGESFADRCEPDSSPRASGKTPVASGHKPPGCGKRCASSNGDPHLRTVDGVPYDFQAAGEFTLLDLVDGSVRVQVRQEPARGVELGSVSNNTAVAALVGNHRVGIYATTAGLELRVDGEIQAGTEAFDLGGGRVERFDTGIVIDLPDGTVIWATAITPYGINVLVDPATTAGSEGRGLIGRSAPGFGIPRMPDGSGLPKPLDRHEAYASLYQRFADAWRVSDATTLFDYDAGKGTASYTIHDYPTAPKVAGLEDLDPARAADGRKTCATVADADLRDECAFDVVLTGDPGYVRSYAATEQVRDHGSVGVDTPVELARPPVEVLPVVHQLAGSALAPDGTLYLSVAMADRSGRVLAIDPLTGQILRQVETTGAGEVAVSAGSVWVGEFSAAATGGFQPCSISRLDRDTLIARATIPTACHRVWSRTNLAAVGDEVWYVDPTAADASGGSGSVRRIDAATNDVTGHGIPLPFADGTLWATSSALFYGDATKGQFRLRPGETAFTPIGPAGGTGSPHVYLAGDGLWADADGQFSLYTSASSPAGTLDLQDADGGTPIAADGVSVYVERTAADGGNELWRRYLDGRMPTRLAVVPRTVATGFGPTTLSYFDEGLVPTFIVGQSSVAKLWVAISREAPAESLILVQGARLPPA